MNDNLHAEQQFAYKVRHMLDHSSNSLNPLTREKLQLARQNALSHQKPALVVKLKLTGVLGYLSHDVLLSQARTIVTMTALAIGVIGTYYWDNFQQVTENEEIDSALLTDDLPINAYLDHGFHAWLNHAQISSE